MKKILFGITSFTLGGAERVLVDLANVLCDKYDITIFTIYAKGELEKQLSPKVKLKSLYDISYKELTNIQKYVSKPLKVLLFKNNIYKKKIKEDYDLEIAFLEGPITRLFACKNKKSRKIAWIHNDVSLVFGNGIKAKLKRKIDEKIYSKYKKLIFVSKDNLQKFETIYDKINNVDKQVIYNYIEKEKVLKKAKENIDIIFDENKTNFVTVARLVPQKAIDRLINVSSKLKEEKLNINFFAIGDGPEKEKLQELVKEKNLESTFFLLGKKENPYPYIKNADYFCLLSNFEGYGMVLEEAKILNKSIVITNTAAREAVEGYENAIILENNEQSIYEGLKELAVENKRQLPATEYTNKEIIKQIENLFEN